MGVRETLQRTLDPELHRCTPYGMQPCNYPEESATVDATGAQQTAPAHSEAHATEDATGMQHPSCTAVAPVELPNIEAQRAAYEERAAIREHEGGQPRADAERGASVDLLRLSRAQADECHAGGWTDSEMLSFSKRQSLMLARGHAPDEAEAMAEALTLRDRQGDDRRICLECAHLGARGRCIAASAGRINGVDKRLEPVPTILQRCEAFRSQVQR
jgi:hypothetical protein